tara:strand:- start:1850 stop:2866 length:1017 start_codon:yes stop_codon:yes gene_type:complete
MKIDVYKLLANTNVYVDVSASFVSGIKENLLLRYKTLKNYCKVSGHTKYCTLKRAFCHAKYQQFSRLLILARDTGFDEETVFGEVKGFYSSGSKTGKIVYLSRYLELDKQFVEGFALYLAEGDTGSNGANVPSKLRFTNSNLGLHKFFIDWIRTYFPGNAFTFRVIVPLPKSISIDQVEDIANKLNLDKNQIKVNYYKWARKTGFIYRVWLDSAIIIRLVLGIENTIKTVVQSDPILMRAYIRGLAAGEGTVYFNKARYVRIEMKNEKEIRYLATLFEALGYDHKLDARTTRPGMWSVYIGAKELKKYHEEIGFGAHLGRQALLKQAASKVLRVNQYC